jgi:hypothetical protein
MKPKEKATELVYEKFQYELLPQAKQYALIVVQEILSIYKDFDTHPQTIYWSNVKSEIQKL